MNVNVWRGKVVSSGSSFFLGDAAKAHPRSTVLTPRRVSPTPNSPLGPTEALLALARHLNLALTESEQDRIERAAIPGQADAFTLKNVPFASKDVTARLGYLQTQNAELELVWDLVVDLKGEENWFDAHVSVLDGRVHSLYDWVSDASYLVYPISVNDPLDGNRTFIKDPAQTTASPHDWHRIGARTFNDTQGNNVRAQENLQGDSNWVNKYRPNGGGLNGSFHFPLNLKQDPNTYIDAAVTNLFFWNNVMHDLFYVYGFDEKAGNFQDENFNRGGAAEDGVIANAQDGSGVRPLPTCHLSSKANSCRRRIMPILPLRLTASAVACACMCGRRPLRAETVTSRPASSSTSMPMGFRRA